MGNSTNKQENSEENSEENSSLSVNVILSILFFFSGCIFFLLFFDSHYKTMFESNASKSRAGTEAARLALFVERSLKKM